MINKKYLPSKKFLVALSIAIVIILIAILLNYWKPSTTSYKNDNLSSVDASSSAMDVDSDGDGLPDWKENLYGTDPHKADTDGDGTSDLDEILADRDPLKANTAPKGQEPNDKIDTTTVEQNKAVVAEYEKLNDTEKFSRDLISNIIASQPANGPMSTDTINSLVSQSISELPQKTYTGSTVLSDLTLQPTDSTNLIKNMTAYRNSYYSVTQKLAAFLGTDIGIMSAYNSENNASTKSNAIKIINKYQDVVNNLIKIPVPVAIGYYDVSYHLTMINDLEKIIAVDKDMMNASDDLNIISDLSVENATLDDLVSMLKNVDTILKISR
jgi:hypothetical protein